MNARRFLPSGPVLGLLGLLALFIILLSLRGKVDIFFSTSNIQSLFHDNSITAVIALGMLFVVISGGIDLSVGSVTALVTVVTMQVYRLVFNGSEATLPGWLFEWLNEIGLAWSGTESRWWASLAAVPAGLLAGALCGVTNGLVITRLRVTPFVATLGMMSLARGLAILLADRTRLSFIGDSRPGWVEALSRIDHKILFFDPGVWLLFVLSVLTWLVLNLSVFGRHVYAIGSNESTAHLCGVPVVRDKVWVYTIAGLFAGCGGILLFGQIGAGDPSAGSMRELEVIAAVVIGGASLTGGLGTVGGTLLGVLILGVLRRSLGLLNLPPEFQHILIGIIVVANTALSLWQRRRSE
jgi:ribose transport system permease protein